MQVADAVEHLGHPARVIFAPEQVEGLLRVMERLGRPALLRGDRRDLVVRAGLAQPVACLPVQVQGLGAVAVRPGEDGSERPRPGGGRCLHGLVGREETDLAAGRVRSELCARLTEEFAGDVARRKDCLR